MYADLADTWSLLGLEGDVSAALLQAARLYDAKGNIVAAERARSRAAMLATKDSTRNSYSSG
jgi:hypothetical protein